MCCVFQTESQSVVAAVLRHLTVISRKDWQAKVGVTGYTHKGYNLVNFANTQGRFHNTELETPDGTRTIMRYSPSAVCFVVWGFGYRAHLVCTVKPV